MKKILLVGLMIASLSLLSGCSEKKWWEGYYDSEEEARIDQLEADLTDLKEKIDDLESKLDDVDSRVDDIEYRN